MKCIFLFLVAIGVAVAQGPTLNVLEAFHSRSDFRTECARETGVDIIKLVQAPPSTWSQFNSSSHKKYFLCVSKKMGWQDENGKFNKEAIRRALAGVAHGNPNAQKVVDELIDECAIEKSTPEDTAYNFVTCMTSYAS